MHLKDYLHNCVFTPLANHVQLVKFVSNRHLYDNTHASAFWQNEKFLKTTDLLTGIHISSRSSRDKIKDEEFFFLLDESPQAIKEGKRVKEATSVRYNSDNSFARWETVFATGELAINHYYSDEKKTIRLSCREDGSHEYAHASKGIIYDDETSEKLERELYYLRMGDDLKENAKFLLGFCVQKVFGLKENAAELLGFERRTKGECAADRIRLVSQRYTPGSE